MPLYARLRAPRLQRRPPMLNLYYRPPHPYSTKVRPLEIVNMQTFVDLHRWAGIKMVNYVVRPQDNYAVTPRANVIETLDDQNAFELYANNAEARIAFAEIALEHIQASEEIRRGPICFVTLVPKDSVFPVGDRAPGSRETRAYKRSTSRAANFSDLQLKQKARQALGDIPFVGMVEAALFHRWPFNLQEKLDLISWHCHLLTWGAEHEDVSSRLAHFRDHHLSLLDGPSAHVKEVDDSDLARQVLYMMKSPQKMTHIARYRYEWRSKTTGEIKPPGDYLQKDWLQTGHRIRLMDIIGHRKLDDLMFGNREGTVIARAIRKEALIPYTEWKKQDDRRRRK